MVWSFVWTGPSINGVRYVRTAEGRGYRSRGCLKFVITPPNHQIREKNFTSAIHQQKYPRPTWLPSPSNLSWSVKAWTRAARAFWRKMASEWRRNKTWRKMNWSRKSRWAVLFCQGFCVTQGFCHQSYASQTASAIRWRRFKPQRRRLPSCTGSTRSLLRFSAVYRGKTGASAAPSWCNASILLPLLPDMGATCPAEQHSEASQALQTCQRASVMRPDAQRITFRLSPACQ